jgi:predicted ester cyclase
MTSQIETESSPDVAKPEDVVRSVFGRIFSGDFSPFDEHPGLGMLKKVFPSMLTTFPDFQAELKQQLVDGDRVASHWIFRGTHHGEFYGVPATGKSVEFQNISICRVVGERVVSYNSEIGALKLLMQFGVLPLSPELASRLPR